MSTSSQLYDSIMYLVVFDGIGGLLPIMVTLYCYYKVYCTLRDDDFPRELQVRASRVFWYSFVQIICFVPEILADIICSVTNNNYPFGVGAIITFLYRSWGFLNLLIYWFLLPRAEKNYDMSYDVMKETNDFLNESSVDFMNMSTASSVAARSRTSSFIV
jgi:uncharacterized membrane protein (DUF485 family)